MQREEKEEVKHKKTKKYFRYDEIYLQTQTHPNISFSFIIILACIFTYCF